MHAGRGAKSTTTIAAACLVFALWLAGCTSVPVGPASTSPLPSVSVTPLPSAPSPTPPGSTPGIPTVAVPVPPTAGSPAPTPSATATAPTEPAGTPSPDATGPAEPEPSREAGTETPEPSPTTVSPSASAAVIPIDSDVSGPAVYYVAIDDGGARGVRFGCNDSLVPVRGAAVPGDPLSVALSRLLEAGMPLDSDAALYDALADSSLRYLSGYMNGSVVVVNLSGSLRPGGICDIPRIQAQLTHTIVSASGATRAEIYINGRTLTEALSVR
ncbi:GerMN domain-containing protein [Paenarthrobacter sp. NPDC056912]|uniref:GerMN domain-containing protein n=1 Tax=Paenarthrobacter sp. NPDC056912 TaxID=3345965 RepID=UPI003672194D